MRPHGRARISRTNPQAQAVCDKCGFTFPHASLRFQYDWQGPKLQNKRILVCPNNCYDKPQEGLRTILIPPDPLPILNPRPELFVADDNPISGIGWSAASLFPGPVSSPIPSWVFSGSALDLDFINNRGFPLSPASALTSNRGTVAGIRTAGTGAYSTVAANALRLTADDVLLQNSGLLVESTITQGAEHTNFSGAVAGVLGSGGSLPTDWSWSSTLTLTIVKVDATGMTFTVSGTTAGTVVNSLLMAASTTTVAAPADVWTTSIWHQFISNYATSNLLNTGIEIGWYNSGGGLISTSTFYGIDGTFSDAPPQTDLTFPYQTTATAPAGTAFAVPIWQTVSQAGIACTGTFRIEAPQLEKLAFRTMFQQAGGRAAETISVNNFALWNAGSCSALIIADIPRQSGTGTLFEVSDGTSNNRFTISVQSLVLNVTIVAGGVALTNQNMGPVAALSRLAIAFSSNGSGGTVFCVGGAAPFTGFAVPSIVNKMTLGSGSQGAWNSTICRYIHFGNPEAGGTLQSWTASLSGIFDNFQRANGAPGAAPTGQTYLQISAGGAVHLSTISSHKLVTSGFSGAGNTAAYTSISNNSNNPQLLSAAIDFSSAATGGDATLVANPEGGTAVNDITDKSVHIVWSDTNLQFQTWLTGVNTTVYSYTFPTAAVRDGVTTYNIGWGMRADGSLVALAIGGELLRVQDARWAARTGPYVVWENFNSAPTQTIAEFQAIGGR